MRFSEILKEARKVGQQHTRPEKVAKGPMYTGIPEDRIRKLLKYMAKPNEQNKTKIVRNNQMGGTLTIDYKKGELKIDGERVTIKDANDFLLGRSSS